MFYYFAYHHFCCLLPVHESFGYDTRCQYLISLTELLEEYAIWETETADPDTLQDTVTPQLIQY